MWEKLAKLKNENLLLTQSGILLTSAHPGALNVANLKCKKTQNKSRHADVCMWWCVGRVDLTSTSYVYSRLVGNGPGRVVADAAIHPSVWHLGLADVEVADHVALSVGVVGDAVAAVPYHWLVVQSPRYPGFRCALHRARQRHKLIDVVDLLAKWSQNLGGAIWEVEGDTYGKVHIIILPSYCHDRSLEIHKWESIQN